MKAQRNLQDSVYLEVTKISLHIGVESWPMWWSHSAKSKNTSGQWVPEGVCQISNLKSKKWKSFEMICKTIYDDDDDDNDWWWLLIIANDDCWWWLLMMVVDDDGCWWWQLMTGGACKEQLRCTKFIWQLILTERDPRNSILLCDEFCAPHVLRYSPENFDLICIIVFFRKIVFFLFEK